MNIVSLIMQFLAPALVSKLAASLGLNQGLAQKVIAAALPAILAGLAGRVAQPGGATALSDILGKQDPGLLGKLASVIGGPQQKQIADQGSNVLGSLLGNSAFGSLSGALTKYAGVGEAPTKSLLGVLAPIVLGTLAQQQKSSGLDAGGLAKMLMGQKDNIAKALPRDFAKLLGPSGLLDSLGKGAVPGKVAVAPGPMPNVTPVKPVTPPRVDPVIARPVVPAGRARAFNWWPWLIAIGLAGAAWWSLFAVPRPQPTVTTTPTTMTVAAPRVVVGGADIGGQLDSSIKGLQGLLGSIRDPQSAQAALPKLRDTQTTLDRIAGMPELPVEARRQIAAYVAQWLPTLTPLLNQLLANTSYGPLLKPVLDQMIKRLETMAKA